MKYLDWLRVLVAASKGKLPKILAIIDLIYSLLDEDAPPAAQGDALEVYEPTADELALEAELSQAMTAEGSQAVWDGSRLRKLVKLAGENGPTILALIKLLSGLAG